jgi:hypothetical protein
MADDLLKRAEKLIAESRKAQRDFDRILRSQGSMRRVKRKGRAKSR